MLGTVFFLWLFLAIARNFGFDFGINLSVFFRTFLSLSIIWLIWLIKINWAQVLVAIKKALENVKDNFITETKETQKEVIRFFPIAFLFTLFLFPLKILKKIFKEYVFNKITLIILVILGILIDIFIFKFTSDMVILVLVGFWIWSIWSFKLESRVSIGFALAFLILCPFLLIFKKDPIAEKSAIWAYMFLVVGVIQMFIEYKKHGERE